MSQTALETIRGVLTQVAPVPVGIDTNRFLLWEARGKFSYAQIRAFVGASIQALNEDTVMAWGDMISLTPEQTVWYMNGGAVTPADVTMGRSRPTLVFGNNASHMIDLRVWALALGGDGRTFEDMTESQLQGSIIGLVTALRDQFDYDLLTRFFSNSDVAIGTTGNGWSVGFCNGSPNAGSGGPKYAPPKYNGQTFYEDHNHYLAVNSAATNPATNANYTYGDGISLIAALVGEHGMPMNAQFKIEVAEADVDTIQRDIRYVLPVADINIDRGGITTGNIYFEESAVGSMPASGGRYVGSVNTKYGFGRLFSNPRIPTGYAGLYRPGPAFAENNALRVRYRPSTGFGCKITEIPDETTTFPVKEIDCEMEYGVSCGSNRFAGAAMQFGSGVVSYTAPTIAL